MPGLLDPDNENGKILLLGDQGYGKTGAKAALVAAGYKLRMVDTDKGFKVLRSLLTDPRYPYANYMKKVGIDPAEPGRISYIPIDVPMDFKTQTLKGVAWNILGPSSSAAWNEAVNILKEWKDGELNLGPFTDWGPDTILDFDTMSTLAEIAKYWVQDMNGHLGSLIDEHGRDTGGAQEMIMRLMSKLTNNAVKCNVIVTAHIKRVDMSNDVPQSAEQRLREKKSIETKGFPAVIGQAVSPYIGKKFNDVFVVDRNDRTKEQWIYTVSYDNVAAKNSVWLEDRYPLSTGLAEIFAALRYLPPPTDLINAIRPSADSKQANPATAGKPSSGFGTQR